MARLLPWIVLLLVLTSCKSLPFGRKDPDERRSEVKLALYVTENANPNPNAPVEQDPAQPAIRVELTGDTLDDMAAQLAAMAKVIEQERKVPGSVRPDVASVLDADRAAGAQTVPPARKKARKRWGREVAESKPAASESADAASPPVPASSALPGLPSSAVFTHADPGSASRGEESVSPQPLGTYRGGSPVEGAPGTVALRRSKPSPLAIQVVQLSDDSMLLNADYDALALDLKKALGTTYLRHDDYVLKPGQYKTVPMRKLDKDALYLGVIAAYHESDLRRWKAVYRLDSTGRRYGVLMLFDEAGATIQSEQLR